MEVQNQRSYTFGTWNVRGLSEKKREAFSEIKRENEDIVVLTETKLRGVGEEEYEGYIHLFSGISTGPARAGVSILLKKEFADYLKWESVSERLIKAEMKISGRIIVIIGVYWVDQSAKSVTKDSFQSRLKSVVESVDVEHELIILGDFNSKVGTDTNSRVVGSFGESGTNNNGRRLIDLCKELNLKIQNTFFDHEDKHKYTWYHPRQPRRTMIDFCITRQDSSLIVEDVIACRWLECGTDHIFLETTVSFQHQGEVEQAEELEEIIDLRKYRTYLLYSKTIRTSYKEYIEAAIDLSVSRTTVEMYAYLKETIHSAAFHVLGAERMDKFGEFLWDQEIKDLRAFRQKRTNSEKEPLFLEKNLNESQFGNIKNEVWEGICATIDNADKYKRNKIVWDIVNDLQNKTSRSEQVQGEGFIYEKICEEDESDHIGSPVNISCDTNESNSDNLINIDIDDVCKALDQLEDCNIPVPGGLTIKLLRYSSNKAKILLKNLIQNVFNGEAVPTEISEVYCTDILRVNEEIIIPERGKCFMHSIMRVMREILRNTIEKCTSFENTRRVISVEPYTDTIFILRQILQKTANKQNPPYHFVLLNLRNSFFDIDLSKLFRILVKEGIPNKLIAVIKHLYDGTNLRTLESGRFSETFYLSKGLTQDFSLSFTLLKMYLKEAMQAWNEENVSYGVEINKERLMSLFLSYSKLLIFSENNENMQTIILSLKLHLENIGLKLNLKNLKYLSNESLQIGDEIVEGEETMILNHSILELDGRNIEEIFERILDTKEVIGILHPVARDAMITKKNKRRIFNSIIRSLLVYGCETWTITEDLKRSFEKVELNYWKWCCENYPQRFSKQEMYDLMDVKEGISRIIMLKKAAWYTNVMQDVTAGWVRIILDWEPDGTLKSGRPRKKWSDGLEEFLKSIRNYQDYFQKNKRVRRRRRSMLTHLKDYIMASEKDKVDEASDSYLNL